MALKYNDDDMLCCYFCEVPLEERWLQDMDIEEGDLVVCHACKDFIEAGAGVTVN